jgi:hypothetical protein
MIPLLITAVVAAGQPAAKPADPAAMAAATALVQQIGLRAQIQQMMTSNVDAMRQGFGMRAMLAQQPGFVQAYQANPGKFDPVLKKAGAIQADVAQKAAASSIDPIMAAATKAYATNFTADELKQLAAFYKTPLGQALLQKQGRVSVEINRATEEIMGAKMQAGMKAAEPQLKAALAPLMGPGPASPTTKK